MYCLDCERETDKTLKDFSLEPFAQEEMNVPVCSYNCSMSILRELVENVRESWLAK